jgi:hypothetical protein
MGFQKHETEEEKHLRRVKYNVLRINGISVRQAVIFRDWTNNKVLMILKGEAHPIR